MTTPPHPDTQRAILAALDGCARHAAARVDSADLLDWLRGRQWLAESRFMPKAHAVLCDPPYGLAFMNQRWDTMTPVQYQAWVTEWASLLLSFMHPGAVMLCFGGTRTFHRLAAGLEDAGWMVSDVIMYVYGSGFPKSHDVSKAIDRAAGAEREIVAEHPSPAGNNGNGTALNMSITGMPKEAFITAPATPAALRWQGYGTALKPAYEPIIVARAPFRATYAQLAQQYGTGALAIDAGRIATGDELKAGGRLRASPADGRNGKSLGMFQPGTPNTYEQSSAGRWPSNLILGCACESGEHRTDCAVKMLDEQSGESASGMYKGNGSASGGIWSPSTGKPAAAEYGDSGTASRFFYTAKAASWEREAGLDHRTPQNVNDGRQTPIDNPYQRGETQRRNIHPTVKPITLTEYLARLILPPKLDTPRRLFVPFAGVGSEMIGAVLAGWDEIIGIEQSAEYAAIGRQRLAWWAQFKSYEQAQSAYAAEHQEAQTRENEHAAGVEQLPLWAAR